MKGLSWPHSRTMRCAPAYGPANGDGRTEGAPRILILSAAVGTGHLRAAEAVQLALQSIQPQARVCNLDILALSIYPFRRCYGGMYLDFVNHAPLILSCAYSLMDRPGWCSAPSRWDRVRVFLEKLGLGRLLAVLREPWDLVINTHFLGGEIVADLRRKEKFFAPQVTVTTDFETNRAWITEPCDHYYTATEEAALYLQKQGVPPGHTSVVGIPVHPVFSEDKDRDTCLARCGLRGGRPVVLQLAGGHGVGRLEEVYRALLEVREPLELVVVTGKNPAARTHLERLELPTRHRVRVLGYTDRIDEFMRAADVVVSKPGGLTSSEALACGTPLVLVDPVPGQEERNSDFLLEQGAAVKANHLPTLAHKVGELLGDPGRMARLKANARRIGRPRAAYDIVARSLDLIGQPVPTGN